MLVFAAGIVLLFSGVALIGIGVLAFRATERSAAYAATQSYSESASPALLDRGAYTTHGMVDGDRDTLVPQSKRADSFYQSHL